MKKTFSQSMAWLHTWSGLIFGWILFAIFLTGSLSVFDREISQWMQPESAASQVPATTAVDRAADYLRNNHPDAPSWLIVPPSDRSATMLAYWQEGQEFPHVALDPATGKVAKRDTDGGHFFVHFHYQLHAGTIGTWIVGGVGLMMLIGLLSGIVIHKRIFKDFFTFRPRAGAQRSWLDAHNALGVLTLPFLLMITFSGLAIFAFMYLPSPVKLLYGDSLEDSEEFFHEARPHVDLEPTDQSAALLPLGGFVERTQQAFGTEQIWYISVDHPGDENAVVSLEPLYGEQLTLSNQLIQFRGITGELLQKGMPFQPATHTQRVLTGLHFAQFGGAVTHWLYFISGLVGTAMIATGLLLFSVKRRRQIVLDSDVSTGFLNVVDRLNVAAIAGPILACLAYLWANRLLPPGLAERPAWEIGAFFAVWALSLIHALWRPARRAWLEQFTAAALLSLLLPLLNMLTSSQHLLVTLPAGRWRLAAVDLTVLALGLACVWLLRRLGMERQRTAVSGSAAPVWELADS
ncbi:putative iron-regulated membrane protein [Methylohalomonas lacus]|uniref:Iron-regulated membrane protein n=1 Tax=Methylohalomonas lacus TaxID=398773 RepID=A0AAE3HJV9_9GAMM|nr:PepSY-associated TM helix domain-containing protein [Methylohalomonas lacus]MCS3903711.1 putative iron-regulated membrane protein [Methylohalomonas lacus]